MFRTTTKYNHDFYLHLLMLLDNFGMAPVDFIVLTFNLSSTVRPLALPQGLTCTLLTRDMLNFPKPFVMRLAFVPKLDTLPV